MRSHSIKSILLLLFFALPALTFAGEIFGTLTKDGKPVAKQEITVTQNGTVIGKAVTDDKGYYSITLKQVGKCTLAVTGYKGATLDVFSTNNSSEHTLTLVKSGDSWILKKQ